MTNFLVKCFVKNNENTQDAKVRTAYGNLAGWVGIVCNLLLVAGKLTVGLFGGSIAIMADALNNLSDASGSVITIIGFRLAAKPADKEHPFGHARFEYIAGLAVAVLVLVIGIELGVNSVRKISNPTEVTFSALTAAVLVASIVVKIWMASFNKKIGERINSSALQATFADSRNDVITTFVVLVAMIFSHFTGIMVDGWLGLAVAAFILFSGATLVKETLNPLIGEAPDENLVKYVGEKIGGYDYVLGTHDLIVHDYGPGKRFASAHVEMACEKDVLESHDIIDNIEQDFLQQDNLHLIIHYDPVITQVEEVNSARSRVDEEIKKIDERLSMHDFRLVDGPTHVNYIFDIVLPDEVDLAGDGIIKQLEDNLQICDKQVRLVVTIDESYAAIPS